MRGKLTYTSGDHGLLGNVYHEGGNTGNVNGAMHNAILEALRSGIAIVLVTNLPRGQVFPIYGFPGGGNALMDAGAVMAEDLKPRKARLLLMFALGQTRDIKRLREMFLNA